MKDGAIRAAEALMDEHARRVPFRPFAATLGIARVDDAYAVQREYVRRQMQARNTKALGYKIGLTSKRMQDMCGIGSPIAGVVLSDRVHLSGTSVSASAYGRVGIEFEIAVRLGRDLVPGDGAVSLPHVAAAVEAVCPAIEIIDDRGADYSNLDVLSVIADNSWNGGAVLGTFVRPWPELAEVEGVASIDGKVVDRGFGRDVLGHPFHAVAWLAGHLGSTGTPLRAGDVIMTGSIITTKFPDRPTRYRYEVSGLGAVELGVG
jgi:2-keto-4-pentenoate hydratase